MIRNVIIMAHSGLVLFSKEFVNAVAQPRLIGSLLTAMHEFAMVTTGMPVAYIELTNIGVTIVTSESAKIFCALFHDKEDGPNFGKLICSEILHAFVEEYGGDLTSHGHNLRDFHGFNNKIAETIKNSVRPVLVRLNQQKGVHKVLLVMDDAVISPTSDVDQLGVLANLQALTGLGTDIMTYIDDDCNHIMLDTANSSRLYLWRIHRFVLIVLVSKSTPSEKYRPTVEESLETIGQVAQLMANLHLVSR